MPVVVAVRFSLIQRRNTVRIVALSCVVSDG